MHINNNNDITETGLQTQHLNVKMKWLKQLLYLQNLHFKMEQAYYIYWTTMGGVDAVPDRRKEDLFSWNHQSKSN